MNGFTTLKGMPRSHLCKHRGSSAEKLFSTFNLGLNYFIQYLVLHHFSMALDASFM